MGDVINESRKECGDPRTWRATEASHQLIACEGKIACRGGELLIITLHARAEKRCGRATSSTGSYAATNLSRGIAWVTRASGGHDAECCPIKVTARRLTLRDLYRAVQRSDLLDGGNGGARSAPGLQECRDIIVVGDRQKELAHAPQGIWRIGERITADGLNARTNLSAPLCRKSGCDGGKDAEICSKLQGECRAHSGKDPLDLRTNSFTREACSQWGIALDCRGGICLHREVEARNKPDRAQHAQRIFNKSLGWITNGAQQTVRQIVDTAMWVNDRPISNRVGAATCPGGQTEGNGVDREVSAREVTLDARQEGDLVGATPITTTAVGAEGGDLADHALVGGNADGAKPIFVGGVREECTQLVWRRFGGEVPIGWRSPSDHIAYGTAHNIGAKSCRSQRAQQVSNIARDGGANRRRGGHAPLAAALSEMKRKSRHAE
jgi:hypothetical protein